MYCILGIIILGLICLLFLYPIRVYTAYQLSATAAWRDWEIWKKKLEEQGFEIELKEVEQSGCTTKFYYSIKDKPLK